MAVYVDPLMDHGWVLRGRSTKNCHLLADSLEELHEMAQAIGMKKEWFQPKSLPHYDLTESRRDKAIELGAVEMELGKDLLGVFKRVREWAKELP